MDDVTRAKALPVWGDAGVPPGRERKPDSEGRGFRDVMKVFMRTWPYLEPQVFGYWRELSSRKSTTSDASQGSEWSFYHIPPLVTVLALIGPLTGWLPVGTSWRLDLLVAATAVMTLLTWVLIFVRGRAALGVSLALVLIAMAADFFAILGVDGWLDNLQMGLVSLGCVCIWVVQYRIEGGRFRLRVRLGSHLVYYYILVWINTLLLLLVALFTVDLLNQSILQAEPLTPFLANFVLQPELAEGSVDAGEPGTEAPAGEKTPAPAEAGKEVSAKDPAGKEAPAEESGLPRRLLSAKQRHGLKWVYVVFTLVSVFIVAPFTMAMYYYNVWILQRINQDLRTALVSRWHRLSLRYHGDHRVGDSVYRIYQDSAQVTAVIGALMKVSQELYNYLVAAVFVAALDPILGLMVVTLVFLAIAWGHWFSPRMRTRSLAAREANSDLTSRIQEVFQSIRVVKAYGKEAAEQRRLEEDSVTAFNTAYRVRSTIAIAGIVMFTVSATILLSGEFLMAIWANGARETFGKALIAAMGLSFVTWNLSAYQWAGGQLGVASMQLQGLIYQWAQAQDMAMGLVRVFDILDIEPDVRNAPDAVPLQGFGRELRFENVDFAYEAERPVLRNVSFAMEPGTITAIVGPTGSGKSTMMSLLSRLFDPDSGSISIDGVDLRKLDVDSLRANVSVALQENVLFGISVRDNIRYVVPEADDERVREAAAVACVDDYIADLPEGLDTVLSDRGGKLSTGQRQRLSIARAVVKDAPILILDEPTAALDAQTEHRVLDRLSEWGAGRAILLITHRISTIQRADQILYLDEGEIVESGSHDELMQQPEGRYRRFVETEARLSKRDDAPPPGGEEA